MYVTVRGFSIVARKVHIPYLLDQRLRLLNVSFFLEKEATVRDRPLLMNFKVV